MNLLINESSISAISNMSTNSSSVSSSGPCIHPYATAAAERFTDLIGDPVSCITIILCPLGIVLNILTITATALIPTGQSIHTKLIISLGISDIIIAVGVLTHFLFVVAFGQTTSVQFSVKKGLVDFGFHATLSNLLIMAAVHYLAIMKPFRHQTITSFHGHCIIAAIWITSAIFGVADFLFSAHGDFEWQYVVTGATLLVFLLIVGIYLAIYLEVRSIRNRNRAMVNEEMHTTKTIITTSFIIITFFLCWMPFVGFNLFVIVKLQHEPRMLEDCPTKRFLRALNMIFFMPMVFNTLCDPLIYAARLQMIQAGYRRIYHKVFKSRTTQRSSRNYDVPSRERRDTTITLMNSNSFKENELRQYNDEQCRSDNKRKRNGSRQNSSESNSGDARKEIYDIKESVVEIVNEEYYIEEHDIDEANNDDTITEQRKCKQTRDECNNHDGPPTNELDEHRDDAGSENTRSE